MHSDWFNGIEILQGRWQRGEKVGYCYPSGLEKTLCKWDMYVPLVTKGIKGVRIIVKGRAMYKRREKEELAMSRLFICQIRRYKSRHVMALITNYGRLTLFWNATRCRLVDVERRFEAPLR